jgi:Outer membrane protein beta-barrel domain
MNKKFTLENYYTQNINNAPHKFDEKLWNKLDAELVPVRDAYNKKEKRRGLILWSSLLLVSGVVGSLLLTNNSEKTIEKIASVKNIEKINIATIEKTTSITIINNNDNGLSVFVPRDENFSNTVAKAYNENIDQIENGDVKNNYNRPFKKRGSTNRSNVIEKFSNKEGEEIIENKEISVVEEKEVAITIDHSNELAKAEKNSIVATKKEEEKIDRVETQKEKVEKKKATSKPTEIYALAGLNSATPIKKSGYFGGVMLEKQIEDKRIFVGLKISKSSLDHEFISANKANIFPQVTDAIIEKVTTIQMPFGYQFKMNKKAGDRSTLLNLGFEPTLLTGVSTIYYDDNGIVGGPRTAVRNSPILKNAVNKFNVSFIAGIKLPVNNKLFFTVNAGYGLINITDKQYYNRSIKNNNLKYIQAGFLLKLK